jgi:hypothetical protein
MSKGARIMTAPGDQPFADQVSLLGMEADVYEAIATLEFLGRPVTAADITAATGSASLHEPTVLAALQALTDRGLLTVTDTDTEPAYQPTSRGWSAAPEQASNPQR